MIGCSTHCVTVGKPYGRPYGFLNHPKCRPYGLTTLSLLLTHGRNRLTFCAMRVTDSLDGRSAVPHFGRSPTWYRQRTSEDPKSVRRGWCGWKEGKDGDASLLSLLRVVWLRCCQDDAPLLHRDPPVLPTRPMGVLRAATVPSPPPFRRGNACRRRLAKKRRTTSCCGPCWTKPPWTREPPPRDSQGSAVRLRSRSQPGAARTGHGTGRLAGPGGLGGCAGRSRNKRKPSVRKGRRTIHVSVPPQE
jgi:hypothetical protein